MTDMPGPNETRLNLIDGVEYITVRADDFRDAMRLRDELHAEVGRLTRADKQWADHVKRLAGERDVLRAENERLEEENNQRASLLHTMTERAAELEAECDQYQAKLTEVWAEVAALRAALQDVRGKVVGVNPIGRANIVRLGDALNLIDDALSRR